MTIKEILTLLKPNERKTKYTAHGIGQVKIDGNPFTDYGAFSFVRKKAYAREPDRSLAFVIDNLNGYATGTVAQLQIDFSLMSIDSYRVLMNLIYSKNEFTVECYDIVRDEIVKEKMYFEPEELPKLWTIAEELNGESWVELLGVKDYTVVMIGTNSALDYVSVVYHFNPPEGSGLTDTTEGEDNIYMGEELVIGKNSSFPNNPPTNYKFKHWVDKNGVVYTNGYAYTIDHDTVLYAVWESADTRTLVFNYGKSTPMVDNATMQVVQSREVVTGKPIGTLPTFESNPTVTYDNKEYSGANSPFHNGEWWKTTTKAKKVDENGVDITDTLKVRENENYWSNYDSTIYLLYDTKEYTVEYYIDGVLNSTVSVKYGETVSLPKYVQENKTFDGWYGDELFASEPPTTMPPFAIKLYARWKES